ncbi:MAG: ATP-binding protein [Holophaga sp.]|nr:ATP-binding protein [Holophaga sp.]
MSSRTARSLPIRRQAPRPVIRSAAWRLSLWATLAFALGTLAVFVFLHRFVAADIQRRSDAWLMGEVEVLGGVADRTPKDALYGQVVEEVARLAGKELPSRPLAEGGANDSVFFINSTADGALRLWVGAGSGEANLQAIQADRLEPDRPTDVRVSGYAVPFRVVRGGLGDGSVYLGLSERDQMREMRSLRLRFGILWLLINLLGFGIVFFATRRMLSHVLKISEAAGGIGLSDLDRRVPTSRRRDEIAHLALTLNHMLDRLERSMHQLHTITNALAHDLRSPLTAIRGQLEIALSAFPGGGSAEPIVTAIEELDRLTVFLNTSLDVAEAKADALRLTPVAIDLDELLRAMIDLYEPSMWEKGLKIRLRSGGPLRITADAGLIHRLLANLFDNELKNVPASCTVTIQLKTQDRTALLLISDDGPGFDPELLPHLFEPRVRGKGSNGHGLGLAFVEAVACAHNGGVAAANLPGGGAQVSLWIPMAP